MANKEYRVLVQGTDILGHKFLQEVIEVAKTGAELDVDQLRTTFPHHAVFFLKTDKSYESTPTITYTIVTQLFTSQEDLDALSIERFREEMKKVGIKSRNRDDATTEYLAKFVPEQPDDITDLDESPVPVVKKRKNKLQTGIADITTEVQETKE